MADEADDEAKAKGNAALSSGDFATAIGHFSEAIDLSPTNHKTVELKPDWSKGFSRLGAAHHGLGNYDDAVSAYKKGLEIDPDSEPLESGLADALQAVAADKANTKGNAAFSSGDFATAISHFSEAIDLSPTNHVLYSNRSAAHASLQNYTDALTDAKKTVELQPDWLNGYCRLGDAYLGLSLAHFDGAVSVYNTGLEIDPKYEPLKSGLSEAQQAASAASAAAVSYSKSRSGANPFADAFSARVMWPKLTANPTTRLYLQQPYFVKMMRDIQKDPYNFLNLYSKDERILEAFEVLLNVKIARGGGDDADFLPELEPEPMELADVENEVKQRKAVAQKEKEAGNAAYKKKDFDTAIQHYSEALKWDDEDISFLTNRAAVYLEMGK
ncbi:heat shock protein STI-like, partial [Trifolium medium]|nr:heat shock protein STI-like [Trifolium medium]